MQRTPSHTTSNFLNAMVDAAAGVPEPPLHVRLRDGDRPFWDGVLCARARDEWTEADLVVAAQLARCQADIEKQQGELDAETCVIENARGSMVMNPRVSVMEQLARREMALMRTLRMGGRVVGDSRHEAGRRKIQRQSAQLRDEIEDEELLAS